MTILVAPLVLVHGNPETPAVWDHLAPSLEAAGRNPVRLSPPGFGAAVPPDFQMTPAGYRDWLIGELERFVEPVEAPPLLIGLPRGVSLGPPPS